MRRYYLLTITLLFAALAAFAAPAQRQILVCVSEQASPALQQAAAELVADPAKALPLAGLLTSQGAGPVVRETSEKVLKNADLAAYNHLVVIGLKSTDPLMAKVWEHYAAVNEEQKTFYAQGWGNLQGEIGYLEADRNPFLHTRRVKTAPFETVLIKITGTSEAGVLAALNAFTTQGLVNGFVPAGAVTRPQTTLLDLDPLTAPAPVQLPAKVTLADPKGAPGAAPLAAWTQVPGNEYRALIDMAGAEPMHVWRAKYLAPHALDVAKTAGWMAGFHRMAYGNAVNIAEFATAEEARKTAMAIGTQGGWRKIKDIAGLPAWQADQPTDENMAVSLGKVTVTVRDRFLLMSTLAPDATVELLQGCTFPAK